MSAQITVSCIGAQCVVLTPSWGCRVQTELGMLPEEALKKLLLASHDPTEEMEGQHSPAGQFQAAHAMSTNGHQGAFPTAPASSSSSQGDTDLFAEQEAEEAAKQEAEAAEEAAEQEAEEAAEEAAEQEARAAEQAAQDPAEQEAKGLAQVAAATQAQHNSGCLKDTAAGGVAASNDSDDAVHGELSSHV